MEKYGLEYINDYANNILTSGRELVTFQNGLIINILIIFLICSAIKIFIFRDDKNRLKNNIIEFIGILFAYIITNSIVLIYSLYYHSETNIELSMLIAIILSLYVLIMFVVYLLLIKLSPYLKPKLISLNNNTVKILKSAMEELKSKD